MIVMELYYGIFIYLLFVPIMEAKPFGGDTRNSKEIFSENKGDVGDIPTSRMTKAQQDTDNLLNTLEDYELAVPVSVNHQGELLGYQITQDHLEIKSRLKRNAFTFTDTSDRQRNANNSQHPSQIPYQSNSYNNRIYYNVTAYNRYFHLNLTLNKRFISSSYQSQYWDSKMGLRNQQFKVGNCHYHGHISNHETTSQVAVSNCNGLFGVFSLDGEQYYIQPLQHTNHTDSEHVHIVYRHSAIPQKYRHKCTHSDTNTQDASNNPLWWMISNQNFTSFSKNNSMKFKREKLNDNQKWKLRKRRKPRSVSEEKYVETLVVVDKMMVDYHGKDNIEPYVLSVMNVVAKLYHDASIGNSISIVLTRLILLFDEQEDLDIKYHADQTLQSFCKWQHKINPSENSHDVLHNGIAHHDNAILLTRFDICSHRDEPCGTLGLAPVAGMCDPSRSCSVVEDIGLATSFTVAHEMGHNFGMQHDGAGNECGLPGGKPAKLMAYQLTKETNPFQWSACSRDYITAFLDSGRGKCLDNEPPDMDFEFPDEMPGQNHSPDVQCQWQYGPTSAMCKPHLLCRELYCFNSAKECITNSIPAADGTPCDNKYKSDGWCFEGKCVERGYTAKMINGKWSKWTAWGDCSRTCGGGVQSSERHCNDPRPRHGGKFCTGERRRYRSCNIQDCLIGSLDFREVQCAKFDAVSFRGKYYKWKPYSGATQLKPCALNCLAEGFNFYTERSPKVIDGTPCYPDSLDVCINGECMKVGCDKILGSEAKEDKCRVCAGDGSSCTTIRGFFSKPFTNITDTYKEVLTVPKGAVNIHIQESTASRNYIAIKTMEDNKFHINGHWTIDWPRKVHAADTVFQYKRQDGKPENLFALGPISQEVIVMLLLQEDNIGIEYEYSVPIVETQSATNEYGWKYTPWTECTATCATGKTKSEAMCVRQSNGSPVDDLNCQKFTKPQTQIKMCNTQSCPPEWRHGNWSTCSKTCNTGYKTRTVTCVQKKDHVEEDVLDHDKCSSKKPKTKTKCNKEDCPPHWAMDEWSKCKPHCGPGVRTRNVFCVTQDGQYQPDYKCSKDEKPVHKEVCTNRDCVKSMWVTAEWEQCNVDCGRGLQKRDVACRTETGNRSEDCDHWQRPYIVRECVGPCLPKSDEECIDVEKVSYCPLVVQFKFCNRAYFHHMCCRTCRDAGIKFSGP